MGIENVLIKGSFPKRMVSLNWDDVEALDTLKPKLKQIVKNYADLPRGTGILLLGGTGTGKTLIATLLAKNIAPKRPCLRKLVTTDELITLTNKKWNDKENVFYKDLMKPYILVVDDFPKTSHLSRDPNDIMKDLLERRFDSGKVTIITSPVKASELGAKFSKDLLSLMKESLIFIRDLEDEQDYRTVKSRRLAQELKRVYEKR